MFIVISQKDLCECTFHFNILILIQYSYVIIINQNKISSLKLKKHPDDFSVNGPNGPVAIK